VQNKQTSSGFGRFFTRNKESQSSKEQEGSSSAKAAPIEPAKSLQQGLNKSSSSILSKIGDVFKGTFDLDDGLFEELEEVLMSCDIGVKASLGLVDNLRDRVTREKIKDADGVINGLRTEITELLSKGEQQWAVTKSDQEQKPYVILMVGVNGVGKTTTTAKIAYKLKQQGKSVMLAAADTFRAAAVEQLQSWGDRLDIPVIAQQHGADAAAVAHDALSSALARNIDVLLIDTAGRLHTQNDLMEQLIKVTRVLKKSNPNYPHEVMQILDAGTGQNALVQLENFQKAVGVSSICLTKLDGSAKGGVAIALTQQYELPIRFIGVGESFEDLLPFNAQSFARGLISEQAT
jgi:fused signal recognition particle receptor